MITCDSASLNQICVGAYIRTRKSSELLPVREHVVVTLEDLKLSSLVPPSVFPTMTRRGLSDAPQELIDGIIDHCSGDKKTLIACSLTCRAWVYRTRRHLFSKLTLTFQFLPSPILVLHAFLPHHVPPTRSDVFTDHTKQPRRK